MYCSHFAESRKNDTKYIVIKDRLVISPVAKDNGGERVGLDRHH